MCKLKFCVSPFSKMVTRCFVQGKQPVKICPQNEKESERIASLDITAGQLLTTVNYCVSNNNGPGISVSYIVNNGSRAFIQRMTLKLEKAL